MQSSISFIIGTRDRWKRGTLIVSGVVLATFVGYSINLLGESSFGNYGPVPPEAAVLLTLVLGGAIAYLRKGILLAWIGGFGVFLAAAADYLIDIEADAPLAFFVERMMDVAVMWSVLFSTIGFVIGGAICYFQMRFNS